MTARRSFVPSIVASAVAVLLSVGLCAHSSLAADPVRIVARIADGPGEGFNDPALGAQRRDAFRAAALLWGSSFESSFPGEIVRVNVSFDPLPATRYGVGTPFGVLLDANLPGRPAMPLFVPLAIDQHAIDRFQLPAPYDVQGSLVFNQDYDFFLGTNGAPGAHTDFVTAVMHELGHVFAFASRIDQNGDFIDAPGVYDLNVENAAGVPLIDLSPKERLAAVTSGNGLFWGGELAIAANGGQRPNLSAGSVYVQGENAFHLSENFGFGDALMSPDLAPGEVIRKFTPVETAMFTELGWNVSPLATIPEPSTLAWLALALSSLAAALRHRGEGSPHTSREAPET
jgi:hypothetical protein